MTVRPRKRKVLAVTPPLELDERIAARLRKLPQRVARANDRGPRYNQAELASKSRLSQSVISKLVNSSNLFGLRLDTIYRLAAALETSVAYLLGEAPAPVRKRPR